MNISTGNKNVSLEMILAGVELWCRGCLPNGNPEAGAKAKGRTVPGEGGEGRLTIPRLPNGEGGWRWCQRGRHHVTLARSYKSRERPLTSPFRDLGRGTCRRVACLAAGLTGGF